MLKPGAMHAAEIRKLMQLLFALFRQEAAEHWSTASVRANEPLPPPGQQNSLWLRSGDFPAKILNLI